MQTDHFNEPTALITGASRGIGAAIAAAFAEAGYHLILICDRTIDDLTKLAADLVARYGVPCKAYQADIGDYAQVQEVFSRIGRLDVLVNNAGISYMGLLSEMDVADWRRVMAVNLDSCFYTCKCAIPLMLQKHAGHILNISSVWGNVGASTEVAYSASKGGVNSFTRALAKELAPSHIQVNAIACGVIDTAMNACLSPEDLQALTAEIPADRLGSPEEVAQLALQIVRSPSYMTGQVVTIDGGWY